MITIFDLKRMSVQERLILANNPSTNEEVLHWLAQDENMEVRVATANNINLHELTQELLAHDENEEVRKTLVYNPSLSMRLRWSIAREYDGFEREILANHKGVQKEDVKSLMENSDDRTKERSRFLPNGSMWFDEELRRQENEESQMETKKDYLLIEELERERQIKNDEYRRLREERRRLEEEKKEKDEERVRKRW